MRLACLCQGVELGAQRQASEGSRQRPWGLGRSGAPRNSKAGCVTSQDKRWEELEVLNAAPCVGLAYAGWLSTVLSPSTVQRMSACNSQQHRLL